LSALAFGVVFADDSCFNYGIDLEGANTNNGLSNLVPAAACQESCKNTVGCYFWTWLSNDYEGSSGFQQSCWLKDNSATTPVITKGAVSGPKTCDPVAPGSCCGTILLDGGSMSDLYQSERMGNYRYTYTDGNGRPVYDQIMGDNYLFWLAPSGPWMVGETVGQDYGGLLNRGSERCPEDLTAYWQYWHTMFESWEEDSWLEATCDDGSGGGGGPGENEGCISGPQCRDCDTWTELEGTLYCCSVDCDTAWIEGSCSNGVCECRCGHD